MAYYKFNRGYNRKPSAAPRTPKPVKTISLNDALAAACMAFHAAGDKIEKYDSNEVPGGQYLDDEGKPNAYQPAVKSNKTVALAILEHPETIPQSAKDEAEAVKQCIEGQLTMSLLGGKFVSPFVKDLAASMEMDELPHFKLGLLVYAPNVYAQNKKKEVATEAVTECLYTSQPLGAVGAKVTVNFTLVESRVLPGYDCYAVFGKDGNGNLVSFLTKHTALIKDGKVSGKIKKAEADKYHNNAMVTSLHYVKPA